MTRSTRPASAKDDALGKVPFPSRNAYCVFTPDTPIQYVFDGMDREVERVASLRRAGFHTIGDCAKEFANGGIFRFARGVSERTRMKLLAACLLAGLSPCYRLYLRRLGAKGKGRTREWSESDVPNILYLLRKYYVGENVPMSKPRAYRNILDLEGVLNFLTVLREEGCGV